MEVPAPLVVHQVTKRFGNFTAVDDISLTLNKGEIFALIGKNGAGKSTLLKLITGLLVPSHGKISLQGEDINTNPVDAKSHFGYIPDEPLAYGYLTGREFLVMTGNLRAMKQSQLHSRLEELLSLFPLETVIDQPMTEYSRGNRQKVAFLASLLTTPDLLIIDEPIVGLDPLSIDIFGETLRQFKASGGSVLFATHTLTFAKEFADRFGVIDKGKLIFTGTMTKTTDLEKFFHTA